MKCPNCGNRTNIHRSHRKETRERVLSYLIFARPYRCHTCMARFWRPTLFPYRRGPRRAPRGAKRSASHHREP